MCRGKQFCTELGNDPAGWSKEAPLMPPVWFEEQLTSFDDIVRLASSGDVEKARYQLRLIRGSDLQDWFIEHGQQSGYFRAKHLGLSKPAVAVALDPVRLPERLAKEVFKRDCYRCRYCGLRLIPIDVLKAFGKAVGRDVFRSTGTNVERHGIVLAFRANADHVIPWKLGGRTEMENLVSACWCCNYGKSSFTLDQIGIEDPRLRQICPKDGWDGLTSCLPGLRASAAQTT